MTMIGESALELDAAALVREAERSFNARDLAAIVRSYRADAELAMCSEGLREDVRGAAAIERVWRTVFAVFPAMQVTKKLASADPRGAVVSEWTGSVDGRSEAYGLDLWWMDPATGLVSRHLVVSFGRVVPARSLAGRLRWLFLHPQSAIRLARALR